MHTHYLILPDGITPADSPAASLCLWCRGKVCVGDPGGHFRRWRNELAAIAGPGELADLLRSERPVAVWSENGVYLFRG